MNAHMPSLSFTAVAALMLLASCASTVFIGMEWVSPYVISPHSHLTMGLFFVTSLAATLCSSVAVNARFEDLNRAKRFALLAFTALLMLCLTLSIVFIPTVA